MKRRITTIALAGALALTAAACDGNAQDDIANIEENIEEGVNTVGEGVEQMGEEMQDEANDGEG